LFDKLNELEMKSPILGKLKKEFQRGKDDAGFLSRLEMFLKELNLD